MLGAAVLGISSILAPLESYAAKPKVSTHHESPKRPDDAESKRNYLISEGKKQLEKYKTDPTPIHLGYLVSFLDSVKNTAGPIKLGDLGVTEEQYKAFGRTYGQVLVKKLNELAASDSNSIDMSMIMTRLKDRLENGFTLEELGITAGEYQKFEGIAELKEKQFFIKSISDDVIRYKLGRAGRDSEDSIIEVMEREHLSPDSVGFTAQEYQVFRDKYYGRKIENELEYIRESDFGMSSPVILRHLLDKAGWTLAKVGYTKAEFKKVETAFDKYMKLTSKQRDEYGLKIRKAREVRNDKPK